MISNLIAKLVGNGEHDLAILRSSAKGLVTRVVGAAIALSFSVMIARSLGASGTGVFFLALAIVTVASTISRFGMDTAIIKIVGRDYIRQDHQAIHGLFLGSAGTTLLIGCLAAAGIWSLAPSLASSVFAQPDLVNVLRSLSPAVPLLALLQIEAAFFLGVHRTSTAFSLQNALVPGLALLIVLLVRSPASPEAISRIYAWSALFAAGAGMFLWRRVDRARGGKAAFGHLVELLKLAPPMLISAIMNRIVLRWVAVILLGIWATSSEVGQFAIAARLTLVLSFALVVSNAVVAPRFARQFAEGDLDGMAQTGTTATRAALILSAPIFVLFLGFPDWSMSMFGGDFRNAGLVLVILATGEFVNVVTGPVGYLLQMTNHEKDYRNCTIVGALTQLVLCILLIPRFAAAGAAIATATAMTVSNLSAVGYAYMRLGIIPVPLIAARFRKEIEAPGRADD